METPEKPEKPKAEIRQAIRIRRGREKGRLFEKVYAEDGTKYDFRWYNSRREFFASPVFGVEIVATNIDAVKESLLDWLKANRKLEWKPVLAVEYNHWSRDSLFGLHYERLFCAKQADGHILLKAYASSNGKPCPGEPRNFREEGSLMPYTEERWKTLEAANKAFNRAKDDAAEFAKKTPEEIARVLDSKKMPYFLALGEKHK